MNYFKCLSEIDVPIDIYIIIIVTGNWTRSAESCQVYRHRSPDQTGRFASHPRLSTALRINLLYDNYKSIIYLTNVIENL